MVPRPEYPRPTLQRDRWMNLNGEWQFAIDSEDVGLKQAWQRRTALPGRILVPFSVGAPASGITDRPAASVLWYYRTFKVPDSWMDERLLLHIGACDYASRVFINGQEAGQNNGGYAPFGFDIAHLVKEGANHLSVRCEDGPSWSQPRGKQEGTTRWPIDYDGVSGIWQTVWIEPVPKFALQDLYTTFSLAENSLRLMVNLNALFTGRLVITLSHAGVVIGEHHVDVDRRSEIKTQFALTAGERPLPLWSPENPNLCDVSLVLFGSDGVQMDEVSSYSGLREICVNGSTIELNGQPLYIRGVLDQGYFPEGWYSAREDDHYRRDIELTIAMGFNCVRKHQKAEDPRYLYWADRLGLLVWSEMPSGRIFSTDLVQRLTAEWQRLIVRDRGHPSIIAWVPVNESWGVWHQSSRAEQRALVDALTSLTRALDISRLVIGNDGWEYSSGDLWTLHLYETHAEDSAEDSEGDSAESLADRLARVLANPQSPLQAGGRVGALPGSQVERLPVLLTECGGIGYGSNDGSETPLFAYGDLPGTTAELERRIRSIAKDVHAAGRLQGFVWTQLTDVQQEMNGLLSFDRQPKLPLTLLKSIFSTIGIANGTNEKREDA